MTRAARPAAPRPRLRLGGVVVLALLFAAGALVQRLTHLDARFFPPGLRGFEGLVRYVAGDYTGAANAYRLSLIQRVDREDAPVDPAWSALLRRDLEQAQRLADGRLAADRADLAALLTRAEVALAREAYREALGFVDAILVRRPGDFDALFVAAAARARLGDHGGAVDALNRALRPGVVESRPTTFFSALETLGGLSALPRGARPSSLLATYHRYLRVFDDAQGDAAITHARAAIAAGDRPADAYLTIGIVHRTRFRAEAALDAFQKALDAEPRHVAALTWAAWTYQDVGDPARAYACLKSAQEIRPDDPLLAEALFTLLIDGLGDYHEALRAAEAALARAPDDAAMLWRAGQSRYYMGDYAGALQAIRRAAELAPRDVAIRQWLGHAFDALEQYEEASEAFAAAVALDPQRLDARLALARSYYELRRLPEAANEYEHAFALGARDVDQWQVLCSIYRSISEFERAEQCLETVLTRKPDDVSTRRLLDEAGWNVELERRWQ